MSSQGGAPTGPNRSGYARITAPSQDGRGKFTSRKKLRDAFERNAHPPSSRWTRFESPCPPDRDYLDQFEVFRTSENVYTATIRLPNGEPYPHKGTRDFENNVMDTKTGTITVRCVSRTTGGASFPEAWSA